MMICSSCIGSDRKYLYGHAKMMRSFEANGYDGGFRIYTTEPEGCPPHPACRRQVQGTVPYAFKPFGMTEQSCRYVGWMDAIATLIQPFSKIMEHVDRCGYYISNTYSKTGEYTGDRCLEYFGVTRAEVFDLIEVWSGAIFLDLEKAICREFLMLWKKAAIDGAFCGDWINTNGSVSPDPAVKGHRHDQSAATLIARSLGMTDLQSKGAYYRHYSSGNENDYMFRLLEPEECIE